MRLFSALSVVSPSAPPSPLLPLLSLLRPLECVYPQSTLLRRLGKQPSWTAWKGIRVKVRSAGGVLVSFLWNDRHWLNGCSCGHRYWSKSRSDGRFLGTTVCVGCQRCESTWLRSRCLRPPKSYSSIDNLHYRVLPTPHADFERRQGRCWHKCLLGVGLVRHRLERQH